MTRSDSTTTDTVAAGDRWLAVVLVALASALAATSLLGPYQGIGLDFVSLALVATNPLSAHLERFESIRTYSTIRRGEVLGYVGDSGNAKGTPTHLHYGVYTTGRRAINPYPLLTQR